MKKRKLEVGEIYQKKGTLDVRTISLIGKANIDYYDIGGSPCFMRKDSFRRWIRRNSAKLIGHYDFGKRKARAVK